MNKTRILLIALVAFLVFPAMAMSLDVSKAHKYVIQYFWSAKGADAGEIPAFETNVNSFLEHTAYSSAGDDNYDSGYLFYRLQQKYEEGGSYVGAPRETYYLDAWSFSNNIDICPMWAGTELFYSKLDGDPGTAGSGLLNNANIRKWNIGDDTTAHERFGVKQIPATGDSLRVKYDTRTIYPTLMETNLTGYDFMEEDPGKAEGAFDTRIYVSGAKKAKFDASGNMNYIAHSGYNMDTDSGPWNSWGDKFHGPEGSGFKMSASRSAVGHEADVLSYEISGFDGYSYSYSNATIFEHAWKTAAMMLRDLKAYNPGGAMDALLAGTLVWDTTDGQVEDLVGNDQGLTFYDDFMRYVFDISALIVQDVNFDGELGAGDDSFIFAVFDDGRFHHSQDWGGNPNDFIATDFDGDYFQGNVVYMCDGATVSVIGTIDDTEQIDALDLAGATIPEPGTIMMVIGGALALAGGIIRKRLH